MSAEGWKVAPRPQEEERTISQQLGDDSGMPIGCKPMNKIESVDDDEEMSVSLELLEQSSEERSRDFAGMFDGKTTSCHWEPIIIVG